MMECDKNECRIVEEIPDQPQLCLTKSLSFNLEEKIKKQADGLLAKKEARDHFPDELFQMVQNKHGLEIVKIFQLNGLTNMNYMILGKEHKQADSENGTLAKEDIPTKKYLFKLLNNDLPPIFIDREVESKVQLFLSKKGLCPRVLFSGKWESEGKILYYRAEEFIEGVGLTFDELLGSQNVLEELMSQIFTIHQIPTAEFGLDSKVPKLQKFLEEIPSLTEKLKEELLETELGKDLLYPSLVELSKDVPLLLEKLKPFEDSVVMCHNDVNSTNVMLQKDRLFLIDYEYAGVGYLYHELGNFIHECSCEYLEKEPYFILKEEPENFADLDPRIKKALTKYAKLAGYSDSEEKLSKFYSDCLFFRIYSVFHWLVLCICNHKLGWKGDQKYVSEKMERYKAFKQNYLSQ